MEKCQEFIKDGESYELCLTTQMRKKLGDSNRLGIYLHLREKNPAPYAAWLNFSKEDLTICCSSPERFLRLDRDGVLEAKPIKGTIARGSTPHEDYMLKSQLQHRSVFCFLYLRNGMECVSFHSIPDLCCSCDFIHEITTTTQLLFFFYV